MRGPPPRRPGPSDTGPSAVEALDRVFEPEALAARPEASVRSLRRWLDNARYWRAFGVADFEPLLIHAPSSLADLGVGVLLRFGEAAGRQLEPRDLEAARSEIEALPNELRGPIDTALALLHRAVEAREALPARESEGFRLVREGTGISAFALRAAGSARIHVEGHPDVRRLEVPLGAPLRVSATDERGRGLPPPSVASDRGAPVWIREDGDGGRSIWLVVPGAYVLQVAGRVGGTRTLVAT